MSKNDATYYRARAKALRSKADNAGDTSARKAHDLRADICDRKAEGGINWLQIVRGNSTDRQPEDRHAHDES